MKTATSKATEIETQRARCRDAARALGAASMDPKTLDADYRSLRVALESAEVALAA
jgi:hypothetical protein